MFEVFDDVFGWILDKCVTVDRNTTEWEVNNECIVAAATAATAAAAITAGAKYTYDNWSEDERAAK